MHKGEQKVVGEPDRERHKILGLTAGVAEHNSLVSCPLVLCLLSFNSAIDILALLVQCGEDSAGVAVKHILALVVAYAVNDSAGYLLYVYIRI